MFFETFQQGGYLKKIMFFFRHFSQEDILEFLCFLRHFSKEDILEFLWYDLKMFRIKNYMIFVELWEIFVEIRQLLLLIVFGLVWFMVLNTTFNNISVILWWSVLLVEETGVTVENHWPVASHWQTSSHNVVHLALSGIQTHLSGDRHWLHM
jgi:hypothetical protein